MTRRMISIMSLEDDFGIDLDDLELCLQQLGVCYYVDDFKVSKGILNLSYNNSTREYIFKFKTKDTVTVLEPQDIIDDCFKTLGQAQAHVKILKGLI